MTIIPKEFNLCGITITTEVADGLVDEHKVIGCASYTTQSILIDTKAAPKETLEQSFVHELVHWILFIMNREELRNDEVFVDIFAHLMYQYMKTARGELTEKE